HAVSARPDRLILGYPVISFLHDHHEGSAQALLGPNLSAETRTRFSSDLNVSPQTPPTFIFHTADDTAVPPSNATRFAAACFKHNVPVELHLFQNGRHGVGLATDNPRLAPWSTL